MSWQPPPNSVPDVSPQALARELQGTNPPLLLDVRRADEFAAGHLPEALHIPLAELPKRLAEIPRDRELVCVCHLGQRSAHAAALLLSHGYPARNLAGGMDAWTGPVV